MQRYGFASAPISNGGYNNYFIIRTSSMYRMPETATSSQRACSKAQRKNRNGPTVMTAIPLSVKILNINPGLSGKPSRTKMGTSARWKKR